MSSLSYLVDPYADTLELPVSGELPAVPAEWEREQIVEHLGSQFQIVRELGRGGRGIVFLARDIALHRLVAIKVLRCEFTGSEEHRERFRREARMTARLNHPNIVPVYGFGEVGDVTDLVRHPYRDACSADQVGTGRDDRHLRLPAGATLLHDPGSGRPQR